MNMNKTTVTIGQVREMGVADALEAYGESESTETPDGGWDSWLINGAGIAGACIRFGEDPEASRGGWSPAMAEKLIAYHRAAVEAMDALED